MAALAWLFACGVTLPPGAAAYAATPAAPLARPAVSVAQDGVPPTLQDAKPAEKPKAKPRSRGKAAPKAQRADDAQAVAPAPAALPPVPAAAGDTWEIVMADRTLHAAMARWAATAGWQLLWELPVDYAVQARTTIPGKFEDAVTMVVTSMEGAEIPMKAVFYQGNRVLRIMAKGAQ